MSFWSTLAGAGGAAMGYDMAGKLGQTGADAANQMGELAGQLAEDTAFKGYGVTTGLGTSTIAADGSTTLGVGQDANMMANADDMYNQAMGNYGSAADAAQANSMNPAYQQAMGAMQNGMSLAGSGSNNPAYQQALAGMQGGMQGLGEQQGGMLNASQQAMMNAMGDTSGREQEIFDRAMAMQNPALDAAQASQQANEFAMGRSGVRGSQFGGTAEDAAMAKARAGAMNQASFQAMGQAQNEMMNQANMSSMFGQQGMAASGMQGQLGGAMGSLGAQQAGLQQAGAGIMGQLGGAMGGLGQGQASLGQNAAGIMNQAAQGQAGLGNSMYQQSFMPMNQQLQALQIAQGNAGMSQSGAFTGAGYGAQLGLGGVQTQVNAEKAATELYGNMFKAMMGNAEGIGDGIEGIWSKLGF